MDNTELLHQLNVILLLVLYLSAPVLGVAAVVGLTVGLLQAVTQIQDQSLPQTLKLVAILLTIGLLGPLLAGSLVNATRDIFNDFPAIAQSGSGAESGSGTKAPEVQGETNLGMQRRRNRSRRRRATIKVARRQSC